MIKTLVKVKEIIQEELQKWELKYKIYLNFQMQIIKINNNTQVLILLAPKTFILKF